MTNTKLLQNSTTQHDIAILLTALNDMRNIYHHNEAPVPRRSSQAHTLSMYASHSSRGMTSSTTAL